MQKLTAARATSANLKLNPTAFRTKTAYPNDPCFGDGRAAHLIHKKRVILPFLVVFLRVLSVGCVFRPSFFAYSLGITRPNSKRHIEATPFFVNSQQPGYSCR